MNDALRNRNWKICLHPTPLMCLETVASSAMTGDITAETEKPVKRVRRGIKPLENEGRTC